MAGGLELRGEGCRVKSEGLEVWGPIGAQSGLRLEEAFLERMTNLLKVAKYEKSTLNLEA